MPRATRLIFPLDRELILKVPGHAICCRRRTRALSLAGCSALDAKHWVSVRNVERLPVQNTHTNPPSARQRSYE